MLILYAVRNKDGEWYSQSIRGGWADDLEDARIYPKIGPARGAVTRLLGEFPHKEPVLVALHISEVKEVLDKKHRKVAARRKELVQEYRQKAEERWHRREAEAAIRKAKEAEEWLKENPQ